MYKRPPSKNAFQYKEPKAKMRKLNVSLSGAGGSNQTDNTQPTNALQLSRPSTSKAATDDNRAASSSAYSSSKPNEAPLSEKNHAPPAKDENLWGDADDEFILIASQMVDNMDMDALGQQIIVQSMNMSQSNAVETVETKDKCEAQNFLKDFHQSTEEEDRLFSEINNFDNIGNPDMREPLSSTVIQKMLHPSDQRPTSPSVFKVPTEIRYDRRAVTIQSRTQIDMNISFRPEGQPQSTQFSQNIEIPNPIEHTESQAGGQNLKVKFLTQKQGDLQKEIEHLVCENQRLTELCQTKDGESSLLRSENERLKNQFDASRREKSTEISKIRNDFSLRTSELEKIILDLKSQLQFKEISSLQNRKMNCTEPSLSIVRQTSEAYLHDWEKFKLPNKSCLPAQGAKPVDPRMYISSKLCDSYWVSINDKRQWEHLNGLQLKLADLMATKDFNNNSLSKMLDEIFDLASLSVTEMYVSSMRTQNDCKKNDFSYKHSDIGEWKEYSIVSENKLFDREEAFLSRRILVCLATICEQFPSFSSMLFLRKCVNDDRANSFLELLALTIKNYSHYRNVANVQGFVESSCLLLTTLAENDEYISKSITVVASILHSILLCRPGIGSLEKISKFLETISYRSQTSDFLVAICLNRNTYDITEPQGLIKYTTDSCTLQVYALLIRLYILPHKKMKFSIKQLTAITQSTLLFMRYSLFKLPKRLVGEKRGGCLCRARLFGAIVTLLYVYLLHWIERPNEIDPQTVSFVSKFGNEFFYEHLVKNYEDDQLNAGGSIIKNRIRIIVEWLNSYDFKFRSAHQHALQSICLQRLGPMVEYLRYNKKFTSKYSAEATEVYNNVKDSFFDDYD